MQEDSCMTYSLYKNKNTYTHAVKQTCKRTLSCFHENMLHCPFFRQRRLRGRACDSSKSCQWNLVPIISSELRFTLSPGMTKDEEVVRLRAVEASSSICRAARRMTTKERGCTLNLRLICSKHGQPRIPRMIVKSTGYLRPPDNARYEQARVCARCTTGPPQT